MYALQSLSLHLATLKLPITHENELKSALPHAGEAVRLELPPVENFGGFEQSGL